MSRLNAFIEEGIGGLKTVKSFSNEKNQIDQFNTLNEKLRRTGTKAQISSGILMPIMRVIDNLSYISVVVFGAILAVKGIITIGVIQTFLLYIKYFLRPINQLAIQLNTVQSALSGAARVFNLIDNKDDAVHIEPSRIEKQVHGKVIFDNVIFGYAQHWR